MRLDDFVVETAEENQIVNLISERLAQVITDTLNQKRTWLKTLSKYLTMNPLTDFEKMTLLGVKVNELGLPEVRSPDLRNTLKNLRLLVELDPKTEDKTSKGAYDLEHHAIIVNIPAISAYATLRDNDSTHILQSTISHELQHALDNVKSQGRGITPDNPNLDWKKDPKGSWKSYASKQHEVNARLQQALLDIAFQMRSLSGPQRLDLLVQRAFDKHSLDKDTLDDAKYNRLLSRAYKFFQAEQQNPKRIEPKSLAQRALAWIQGGAGEQIIEVINPKMGEPGFHAEKDIELPIGKFKLIAEFLTDAISPQFKVRAINDQGKEIGSVRFVMHGAKPRKGIFGFKIKQDQYVVAGSAYIWTEYQKKGLAKEIYKFVQELGNDIRPSTTQTDAGKAMWRSFEKNKALAQ